MSEGNGKQQKIDTIEAYIARYEGETRVRLECLRDLVYSCSADITGKISWGMMTFVLKGNLVHVAAQKHHIGFYPGPSAVEAFAGRLEEYKHSKGTVQLPYSKPVPYDLIREMIVYRINEQTAL